MASCPGCEASLTIEEEIAEGETLECPECGAQLEVVNANPLELGTTLAGEEEAEEDL